MRLPKQPPGGPWAAVPRGAGTVVVVASPGQRAQALAGLAGLRTSRRLLFVVGRRSPRAEHDGVEVRGVAGKGGLHRELTVAGAVDAVVMLRHGSASEHRGFWRQTFLHLSDGGRYVVPLSSVADRGVDLAEHARALSAPSVRDRREERELARTVGAIDTDDHAVVVTRRRTNLVKLREQGAPRLLNRRSPDLRVSVVERRRPGVLGGSRSHTSWPASAQHLDDAMPYPPAVLRRYDGPVDLHDGVVAVHGGVVLPESFKWHLGPMLTNNSLVELDARWARFRHDPEEPVELEGSYYYLDYKNIGHYGHLLVEAVPKLWGWETAKELVPDLKLLRRGSSRPRFTDPTQEILTAYGIPESDVVTVDGPVRVRTLFGATPMLHAKEPYHAHAEVTRVWDRLREGMLASDPRRLGLSRIFVTRHAGNRPCRNVEQVDRLFAGAGFAVVRPEELSRPEQAALFAEADVVAGFGGTGLFNLVYSTKRPPVIVLNHDSYDARNEHIITAALGSDVHYFWSRADISQPEGEFSKHAFKSSWAFDFEANGAALRDLLESLSP